MLSPMRPADDNFRYRVRRELREGNEAIPLIGPCIVDKADRVPRLARRIAVAGGQDERRVGEHLAERGGVIVDLPSKRRNEPLERSRSGHFPPERL